MNIAFLGDSITFGYGLADKSKRYSTLVSHALGMNEENYGITGTLMAKAGLNRENDNAFVSRVHLIKEADVAVIFGCTNDYFWSDCPIKGEGIQHFACAVETIVAYVKEHRRGKLTFMVTPYPHNGVGNFEGGARWDSASCHDTSEKNFNGHTLLDYVNTMEAICAENGVPCLNLHQNFPFDWHIHTSDGCHPNEEGHKLLAKALLKLL